MAWIISNPSGTKAIQYFEGKKRRTITVGEMDKVDAASIKRSVEHLIRYRDTGGMFAIPNSTANWVESVRGTPMEKQLIRKGLIAAKDAPAIVTLADWIETYIERRTDVKPATLTTFGNLKRNLMSCFDGKRPLASFTPGDGDIFKSHLAGKEGLSENTVRRRIGLARQLFNAAIRSRLTAENPFAHLPTSVRGNRAKFHFITMDDYKALIKAAPNVDWRCIIALARIGGVRIPSEALTLKWEDIDWAASRIRITSPKTEHHGQGARIIPLFPELLDVLTEAFGKATDHEVYVITRYRSGKQNLRTQFSKIIRRAGLTQWPKLFVNMRASRATELAQLHPQHVCSAWLGHSATVASEHYLRVRDEDFAKATARSATQSLSKSLSAGRANGEQTRQDGDVSRHGDSENRQYGAKTADVSRKGQKGSRKGWAILDSNQ